MTDQDVDPNKMSIVPVLSTIWPSTPWNDSWSDTIVDPLNYVLVGLGVWTTGILFSVFGIGPEFVLSQNTPAIVSVYGSIITLIGFILTGAGTSLFSQKYIKTNSRQRFTVGSISVEQYTDPLLHIIKSTLFLAFVSISLIASYEYVGFLQNTGDTITLIVGFSLYYIHGQFNLEKIEE